MTRRNDHAMAHVSKMAFLLCAAVLATPISATASGHDKQELIGDWRGATTDKQESNQINVSVDMQITQVKINEKGGRFHFGPPRSCEMSMIYKDSGPNDSFQFYLVESHGGFCDRLNNALVTFHFDSSQLGFAIASIGTYKGEHGMLKKGE